MEENEEDEEEEEFYREMTLEELKAKAAKNPFFQPGYVEDEEEEAMYAQTTCQDESSSDDEDRDWYQYPDGNPNDRKGFFVFENDRTLDPKYNMAGAYEDMKTEIQSYITTRLERMEIEEEERAGFPGFDPLPIKHHYDLTFSDDEEAEVMRFFNEESGITQLLLCREVMSPGTPVTKKKRSREKIHFPILNTALVIG